MKISHFFTPFLVITLAISCSLFGAETFSDPSTGKTFPTEVSFDFQGNNINLKATGVATRKKFFIKVYSIAHYMQDPSAVSKGAEAFSEIINSNQAKQFTMIWARSVSKKKIKSAYLDSFEKALGGDRFAELRPKIDQYVKLFNSNAKTNDTYVIRWIPNNTVEVYVNGKKRGSVEGKEFARGLWSIWLGSDNVVKRNGLISRL